MGALKLPKKPRQVRDVPQTASAAVEAGRRKNKAAQSAHSSKRRTSTTLTLDDVTKTWGREWEEYHSTVTMPLWKTAEKHALFQYGKRYAKKYTAGEFLDYLAWCIRMWSYMTNTWFKRMDNKPPYPSLFFLVRHSEMFEQVYRNRMEVEKRLQLTTRERMVKELVSKGVPEDVAGREVDEKLGIATQRQRLEQERRELQKERLAFDRQKNYRATREAFATKKRASQFMQKSIPPSEIELEKGFGAYEQPTDG